MDLLVVGSVAYDNITTPYTKVNNSLGGSATFIAISACNFVDNINLVGIVGEDFKQEHIELLKKHKVNIEGLEIVKGGKTFAWTGVYHDDFINRDTISTELNVFADFNPVIPESQKESKYVLLGNIDPILQNSVLSQLKNPEFVICDTMNYWIESKYEDVVNLLKKVNVLIINDSEARLLAKENNLIKAAKKIIAMGLQYLVIKRGEHGATLFYKDEIFAAPAFPIENLADPTGAGDTFAGGFGGWIAQTKDISFENMKKAIIYGSVMASYCVEEFSVKGFENISNEKIEERFSYFKKISSF